MRLKRVEYDNKQRLKIFITNVAQQRNIVAWHNYSSKKMFLGEAIFHSNLVIENFLMSEIVNKQFGLLDITKFSWK